MIPKAVERWCWVIMWVSRVQVSHPTHNKSFRCWKTAMSGSNSWKSLAACFPAVAACQWQTVDSAVPLLQLRPPTSCACQSKTLKYYRALSIFVHKPAASGITDKRDGEGRLKCGAEKCGRGDYGKPKCTSSMRVKCCMFVKGAW